MRKTLVIALAMLALMLSVSPSRIARADEQWGSEWLGSHGAATYDYAGVSLANRGPILNAMAGWNAISANHWGAPYQATLSASSFNITEYDTVSWPHSSSWVGYTTFGANGSGIVSSAQTDLDNYYFVLNQGTTHYCCAYNPNSGTNEASYPTQDTMVHELGFIVALHENCYGAGAIPGSPADTTANSAMCDLYLTQNHAGPASNDVLAVQYIYR